MPRRIPLLDLAENRIQHVSPPASDLSNPNQALNDACQFLRGLQKSSLS